MQISNSARKTNIVATTSFREGQRKPYRLTEMNRLLPCLFICIFMMASCRGTLLVTAELHGAGTAEARFHSSGKALTLWADTDGKWHGRNRFPAHYEIEIFAGSARIGHLSCDSADANTQICGTRIGIRGELRGDCELELTCELPPLPVGEIVLSVTGTPGENVTEVTKMSVNVRER
jgi:hypothetical protein